MWMRTFRKCTRLTNNRYSKKASELAAGIQCTRHSEPVESQLPCLKWPNIQISPPNYSCSQLQCGRRNRYMHALSLSWTKTESILKLPQKLLRYSIMFVGEENSNPLQCSYLESPTDRGAWWATVHGITYLYSYHQRRTGYGQVLITRE